LIWSGGRPALHRPDLVLLSSAGGVVAVEVELSIKAPRRLEPICREWARARHVDATVYLAEGAVARAVARAVRDVSADEQIGIVALDEPEGVLSVVKEGVGRRVGG